MVRKYRIKSILFVFFVFISVIFIISHSLQNINNKKEERSINCSLLDKISKCIIVEGKVYLSSSDIKQLFDIHGYMNESVRRFYLTQSNVQYSKPYIYTYNSRKKYLFFDKYFVELRPKVKWISTDEGVPLSIQWSPNEYPYPIQIAQFGLSHYSKWIEMKDKAVLTVPLELAVNNVTNPFWNFESGITKNVKVTKHGLSFFAGQTITEDILATLPSFTHYGNSALMSEIEPYVASLRRIDDCALPEVYIVGTDWIPGSGVYIKIRNNVVGNIYLLYLCGDFKQGKVSARLFLYSFTNCDSVSLARNLYVDIVKLMLPKWFEESPSLLSDLKASSIEDIILFGQGTISTFQLCNQFSFQKFLSGANWFLNNQDKRGGWTTNVTRRIYAHVKLNPGWYSAMAQGHGLSLLMRAFHVTNDMKYLKAASGALGLFDIETTERGIRTYFLGQKDLVWYEEYPTRPSLFILNGFIYSLFGLLDYVQLSSSELDKQKAERLLKSGMKSLQTLLPLFDSGFGSFYDLRHVTFPAENVAIHKSKTRIMELHDGPNRARWEYHVVHIEQLLYLAHATFPKNKFLIETAERFIKYLRGYRSAHN